MSGCYVSGGIDAGEFGITFSHNDPCCLLENVGCNDSNILMAAIYTVPKAEKCCSLRF